jgi:hypothetical protein
MHRGIGIRELQVVAVDEPLSGFLLNGKPCTVRKVSNLGPIHVGHKLVAQSNWDRVVPAHGLSAQVGALVGCSDTSVLAVSFAPHELQRESP